MRKCGRIAVVAGTPHALIRSFARSFARSLAHPLPLPLIGDDDSGRRAKSGPSQPPRRGRQVTSSREKITRFLLAGRRAKSSPCGRPRATYNANRSRYRARMCIGIFIAPPCSVNFDKIHSCFALRHGDSVTRSVRSDIEHVARVKPAALSDLRNLKIQ